MLILIKLSNVLLLSETRRGESKESPSSDIHQEKISTNDVEIQQNANFHEMFHFSFCIEVSKYYTN